MCANNEKAQKKELDKYYQAINSLQVIFVGVSMQSCEYGTQEQINARLSSQQARLLVQESDDIQKWHKNLQLNCALIKLTMDIIPTEAQCQALLQYFEE